MAEIRIDVNVATKQAEERLKKLQSFMENMGDDITDKEKQDILAVMTEMEKFSNRSSELINKIQESVDKIDLGTSLGKELDAAREKLEKLQSYPIDAKVDGERVMDSILKTKEEISNIEEKLSGIDVDKLTKQNERWNEQLYTSDARLHRIIGNSHQLESNILAAGDNTEEINSSAKGADASFKRIEKSTKKMSDNLGVGLKNIFRYGLALFSIRSIYTMLSRLSRQWLDSNDMAARQLKANINAMSSALSNMLAPVMTYLVNIMATIFGYANAILKVFFGIDLLSKNTGKNVSKGIGGGMKKANKEMKKFTAGFDEAEVISSDIADNLDGAGGGVGVPDMDISHNIKTPDLTHIKEALVEAFDPFIQTMKSIDFEPLEKAFENLAKVGKESAKIIGDSFVRVMNNSVAPFIKLLVEDIVPAGLNTVARILDRLNPVIDRLLRDFVEPLINWFLLDFAPVGLNLVFSVLEGLGGILAVVVESFNEFWDSSIGRAISFAAGELVLAIMEDLTTIFDEIVESVDFFFEALEEGEPFAVGLAWAIGLIASALVSWSIAQGLINAATAIFNSISPFGWMVIAITAVIAIILVLYKNWDNIVNFFEESLDKIGQWFADKWQGIKDSFSDLVQSIKDWWSDTVQKLKDGWQGFLDKGRDVIENIKNFFTGMIDWLVSKTGVFGQYWSKIIGGMLSGIKVIIDGIKGVFNGLIKFITGVFTGNWAKAWEGVKDVFRSIVSGISNIFKIPINLIIDGINSFVRGINKIKIPKWVPGVGGRGFSIAQIPRLAEGAVLTQPTLNIAGEYPNARRNPEIVTPENKMREAMEDVLSRYGGGINGTIVVQSILDGRVLSETVIDREELKNLQLNGGVV